MPAPANGFSAGAAASRIAALAIATAAFIGVGLSVNPTTAQAQTASGVGDDAIPIAPHGARIRIGGLWTSADSRFTTDANGNRKKTGWFDGVARDNLGPSDIPMLAPVEDKLRTLSGLGNSFSLSLGKLEARGDISRSIVPLQIEYGVTRRLSVSLLVPYVETTANSRFVLNRGGAGATVGQNPGRAAGSTARNTNTTVAQQIDQSRTSLTTEIARCADAMATGGGCDAIRANPAAAQALLAQAQSFRDQMAAVYGTTSVAGSPVVPIIKSQSQLAIENRLLALRESFMSFASNALDGTTLPVGATTIYGTGGLQSIAQDSAFQLAYDTLAQGGRAGIGDIDVAATFLLINTFGNTQRARLTADGRGLRSTITGGWRFGTATGGRSGNPFDLPTGDGANALLLRSTTDLMFNRKFWMSGSVRFVKPLSDNVVMRFPAYSDSNLFKPSIQVPTERSLGAITELELAPRWNIARSFGVSLAYAVQHRAGSTLNAPILGGADILFDVGPEMYTTNATTAQTLQFGATYSTLNAFINNRSRWPVEILYSHGFTLAGSGGVVPATSSDRIELRVYTRFPRR